MADALLGSIDVPPQLGALTLRAHQVTAVARLLEIMGRHRGALLADSVGLGKTYVALAIAERHAHPLVICPAALRQMWERVMKTVGRAYPVLSIESLSRGAKAPANADLLIVDEAHHLRTPGTRRYEAVAQLARHARVLLLSATPLHNSRRDLAALLALFAGTTVRDSSDAALARMIVRRDAATAEQDLPELRGPHLLPPGSDDDCLDAILAIPPAIPAADEGVAHALATISLVHLWTSSRAALLASVRRRLARALALRDAISSGHVPTATELSAWRYTEGALQLAFPLVLGAPGSPDPAGLTDQLHAYIEATEHLIDECLGSPNPDLARVHLLRTLRVKHPGARCVAFSQYATTVESLGRLMRADPGIATVTADGGRIASGSVRRDEVLAQFARDAPPARAVERIELLLTTDLLSEGIDLRGASVIVHLDLPWNPARLEQRVGRARRLGSPHEAIDVYAFVPPTAAERMIELRRRLMAKVRVANAVVGGVLDPLGSVAVGPSSPVTDAEVLRARVQSWRDVRSHYQPGAAPAVGAARATSRGWIAVVIVNGLPRMLCSLRGVLTDDPRECLSAVDAVGAAVPVDDVHCAQAMTVLRDWLASRAVSATTGEHSPAQRAVLERLAQSVARSPRHRRTAAMGTARRARAKLATCRGVGAERVLAELARSTASDDAWLEMVGALEGDRAGVDPGTEDGIVALILLE